MFRILYDPSSGSVERASLKITCDIFVCVIGVWLRDFLDLWCVCLVRRVENYCSSQLVAPDTTPQVQKSRCQTPTTHTKISQVIFSQARSTLPEDGS